MQNLNIAIVGLGLMGKRHAEVVAQCPQLRLAAVVEPDAEAQSYARERGIACYPDLAALFAAQRPDGVIIATPTPLHVEQALRCVEHGCSLLIEKPLATSARAAAGLVQSAERAAVPILVGHHRRHNPLIQQAKQIIAAGSLGTIKAVHAQCWFYKPDSYFAAAPWRQRAGAGPISVNLAHDVDLLRHLCGDIAAVQAQAQPSSRGYANEEVAAALLRFTNGALATITVADTISSPWSWELTAHEHPIYPATNQDCYHIGGTRASLAIPSLQLWQHAGAADWWQPIGASVQPRAFSNPLLNQMQHFAAVISGVEPPLVSGAEGLRSLAVIEAMQNSAAAGGVSLKPEF